MRFDPVRYIEEYIKRRKDLIVLSDDLVERYALTLPASDADIAGQIGAVREFWNGRKPGTRGADIIKLCLSEDERLRTEHGHSFLTAEWWSARAEKQQDAAKVSIARMADQLRTTFGSLGIVTAGVLDSYAAKHGLSPTEAATAAAQASLQVVTPAPLPQGTAIPPGRFKDLQVNLQASGARTVPELVHPGSGRFTLLGGYVCLSDKQKRLDAAAVQDQITQADKRGVSIANDSRREALRSLIVAARDRADLPELALCHMMSVAEAALSRGLGSAREELTSLGLEAQDATLIVIMLVERSTEEGAVGVAKVQSLLAEGRLNEARQAAQSIPGASNSRASALKAVDAARARLDDLLAEANAATAESNEVRAASLLREAASISADDAEEALAVVPLPPPAAFRLASEGDLVKLYWQPAPGHDGTTSYLISRSEKQAPLSPADGTGVGQQSDTSFVDPQAPVARTIYYSVFASTMDRPSSRAAGASILLVPPVSNLRVDVGPSEVTVHWSAHPGMHQVEAVRAEPGKARIRLEVLGNSCHLTGLAEGQLLHFEITALYRGVDGGVLRSPVAQINATPRSEAKPLSKLRTRLISVSGEVRVRVSWTPVDNSEVSIRRSASPAPWTPGTWVSAADMSRWGTEVTGRHTAGRAELAIEAELPPGVHNLMPFSIGGTGIVAGHGTAVGVTDPVMRLTATPFASYANLSWEWPTTSQLAEVAWELDGEADMFVIGKSDYQTNGGAKVPLGRRPCKVEVRALIQASGASFTAPPVSIVIDAVTDVEIKYAVTSTPSFGPLGGRKKKVTFVSDEGCSGVHVRLVATSGAVMPTGPDGGFILLDTALELTPGTPTTHPVTVPRAVSRPYWVRCFIVGGRGRLTDPPVNDIRET